MDGITIPRGNAAAGGPCEARLSCSPRLYLSDDALRDAVDTRFQFNILDMTAGLKIDVILFAGDAFDQSRRGRVRRVEAATNLDAWFASPEDVIIKKLLYFQEGGSDKHLRDIGGMLRVSAAAMNINYISEWAARLGVSEIWQAVVQRENHLP